MNSDGKPAAAAAAAAAAVGAAASAHHALKNPLNLASQTHVILSLIAGCLESEEYVPLTMVCKSLHAMRKDRTIKQNSEFDTLRIIKNVVEDKANTLVLGEGGTGKTRSMLRLLMALRRAGMTWSCCAMTGAACNAFTNNALATLEMWRKQPGWWKRLNSIRRRAASNSEIAKRHHQTNKEGGVSRKRKRATSASASAAAANESVGADGVSDEQQNSAYELEIMTDLAQCQTLHSFASIGAQTKLETLKTKLDSFQENHPNTIPQRLHQFLHTDVLFVDEISMGGCKVLEKVDFHARRARATIDPSNAFKPFGGMIVVMCGDWLQIKPVADHFAFTWQHWDAFNLRTVVMTHMWRQRGDPTWAFFLSRLRIGAQTEDDYCHLEARAALGYNPPDFGVGQVRPVHLVSENKRVMEINQAEFAKLPGDVLDISISEDQIVERVVNPITGTSTFQNSDAISIETALSKIDKYIEMKAPSRLEFKDGAQYILTCNLDVSKGQVNSATCIYEQDVDDDGACEADFNLFSGLLRGGSSAAEDAPSSSAAAASAAAAAAGDAAPRMIGYLRFKNQSRVRLSSLMRSQMQPVFGHPNLYLRRKQYSLRLGYACTFHGCQGATFDQAVIDLRRVNTPGAAYVALSRVRRWDCVWFIGFERKAFKVHKEALFEWFKALSIYRGEPQPQEIEQAAAGKRKRKTAGASTASLSDNGSVPAKKRRGVLRHRENTYNTTDEEDSDSSDTARGEDLEYLSSEEEAGDEEPEQRKKQCTTQTRAERSIARTEYRSTMIDRQHQIKEATCIKRYAIAEEEEA